MNARTPAYFIDFLMPKQKKFEQKIPEDWNSIIFVYKGALVLGEDRAVVPKGHVAQFEREKKTLLSIET